MLSSFILTNLEEATFHHNHRYLYSNFIVPDEMLVYRYEGYTNCICNDIVVIDLAFNKCRGITYTQAKKWIVNYLNTGGCEKILSVSNKKYENYYIVSIVIPTVEITWDDENVAIDSLSS